MRIPSDVQQLAALFRRLGARNPEAWAESQVGEGINQLHRYLFLRQAWSRVIAEDDQSWIDRAIVDSKKDPDAPYAAVGHSLSRLLAGGASRGDLADLVRGMQALLLFHICYLLDDSSLEEPELANVGWSLVETDEDLEPTGKTIGGLHESVLDTDPTGREMRPRKAP
jgi:hypothetical protein